MWVVISRIILRFRLAILLSVLLATAFMLYQAKSVKLSYQMAKILPKTSTEFKDYKNFKTKFGDNRNDIVIGVINPDLFTISQYNAWVTLSNDLNEIVGVKKVTSIENLLLLVKDTISKSFKATNWHNSDLTSQEEFDKSVANLLTQPFYNMDLN